MSGWRAAHVEQLRQGDRFRRGRYEVTYVVVDAPRMGAWADTTVVGTEGALMTFRLGELVQVEVSAGDSGS